MNDDAALLRRYAEEKSESAFAELVRRHLDLVHSATLRRLGGDTHQAADVAQHVFTTLARDAAKLSEHAVLTAWLYTATRNAATDLIRSDQRRRRREQKATLMQNQPDPSVSDNEWEKLRPVLDEVMDELPEADRTAVLLRFFEKRGLADIGAVLGMSEDAARMRVSRALDKLRALLDRRGIKSTSSALATVFAQQVTTAAPAGLAASISRPCENYFSRSPRWSQSADKFFCGDFWAVGSRWVGACHVRSMFSDQLGVGCAGPAPFQARSGCAASNSATPLRFRARRRL